MYQRKKQILSPLNFRGNNENFSSNGISFKNLQKKRCSNLQQHYLKQNISVLDDSKLSAKLQNQRNQMTAILRSKEKQMNSLQSQVKVLEGTNSLLREQLQHSVKQIKRINNTNAIQSKIVLEKDQSIRHYCEQNMRLQKQLNEYIEITSKLNQLEQIQNNIVDQNRKYKGREDIMKSVLSDIRALIKDNSTNLKVQICELINVVLN